MTQQWLTVVGLGLDLAGFCLLLREWWIGFFHETQRLRREAQEAMERSLRAMHQASAPDAHRAHLDTATRLHEEMNFRAAQAAHREALGSRRAMFLAATVLILVGMVLQILGAIPGCCEPWIRPIT